MFALVVPFLMTHLSLPSWVVKALAATIAVCVLLIAIAVTTWQLRVYAEHQTALAAAKAADAAKAEIVAKVNAASEAEARAAAERAAAAMRALEAQQARQDGLWTDFNRTIQKIEDTAHDAPLAAPPVVKGDDRAVKPLKRATADARDPRVDLFSAGDDAADRLLEHATEAP